MAATQPEQQDRLLLNLSSNNPFRNRAVSPSLQSPTSPFDDPPPRPTSRNPFLDPALATKSSAPNIRSVSDSMSSFDKRPSLTAEEIFGSLTLEDKAAAAPPRPDAAKPSMGRRGPPPPGRENMPPGNRSGGPPNHRPTRSQEEALRARKQQGPATGDLIGSFGPDRSPPRRQERRPRRNSESSVVGADRVLTEEERKARDQRRRDRERRHRDGKDRKPVSRKLDIIDQLDATSIYGTGIFHHDGPFDALNPHRNRTGSRRAPMQAFPEGSLNNTLGGSGPLNARPDHATFLGQNGDEAFQEWSTGKDRNGFEPPIPRKGETPVFDPLSRGSVLHGDESLGLGTSTFLEGTPAARTAIQKREEERAAEIQTEGLQRKKSLAHRIRNINRGPRDLNNTGRLTNPEGAYSRRSPSESGPASAALTGNGERNPFFSDYGSANKGGEDGFAVRKMDTRGSPTSPKGYGLERRSTTDATGEDGQGQPKSGGGLLGRMKSLKGGRRQRPGQGSSDMGTAAPAPGTAV
ncbi:Pal1 cell morphology protein-domain-containing protein [Podospora australis]|uniref:Pal1 cell morphology protein-domain-containing protein n=1 Tax=Podospora australis TaxID=1536484 RepID=A0AAN6WTK3_9PEZI|nr:Pal1 cell morphology protein-domain-containing protein [Podospora australis]